MEKITQKVDIFEQGSLREVFGLSEKRSDQLLMVVFETLRTSKRFDSVIKKLCKGFSPRGKDIAFQFTAIGLQMEKNNRLCQSEKMLRDLQGLLTKSRR